MVKGSSIDDAVLIEEELSDDTSNGAVRRQSFTQDANTDYSTKSEEETNFCSPLSELVM